MSSLVYRVDGDAPRSIFAPSLRGATVGLVTVITVIAFEAMAVGPALPTAARQLHGLGAYGWAFTTYLGASVVGMVAAGLVSDANGPKRPLIAGMGLFVAGLLIAGTATTMTQLVMARAVQGFGGGVLITAAYVVIGETYPEALRPKVFVATSSAWLLPSLVGPPVSGALAQHVSWRWVFLGLVPFVLAGWALLAPSLRRMRPTDGGRLGDPRRLLRALFVAGGVSALEAAGQDPSLLSLVLVVLGLAALGWGLHGLLPPGTFRVRRGASAPVAMRGLVSGAIFGTEAVIPLMMMQQHGFGATVAGLPLAMAGISWTLGSWWQGRAHDGDRAARAVRLLRGGYAFLAAGIALIAVTALPASPGWLAFPAWLLGGLGAGLAMPTTSVLLLAQTNDADRGADSAALQLSDTTMASLTTGFAGVLVAAAARGSIGYTGAFVVLALVMIGVALIGVAVAGRARPKVSVPASTV